MPIRGSKNVRPRYLEFPPDLDAALEEFGKGRGQSFKAVVVDACRRHLAYPPPAPEPPAPLPGAAPPPTEPPKRKGRKGPGASTP